MPMYERWAVTTISTQYTNRTNKQPTVPAPAKKRNRENSDRQSATAEAEAKVACEWEKNES